VSDFDSPWKEALDLYFEAFLAFFFPQTHAAIDWTRGYETLDKELQQVVPDAERGRRLADKLVKVWRRDGEETWVLIHVEVQGQAEADFPQRMYVYNYRLFDRYNRQVVSLAVLTDERANWRPDRFGYSLWGCTVGIQFPVVKLLDYAGQEAALEAHPNPFATVVLAHLKALETRGDAGARYNWKLHLARGLYARGMDKQVIFQLLRFMDWMMDLPRGLALQFHEEVYRLGKEKIVPYLTSFERFALEKGLLEGIEAVLEVKFGAAGLELLPEIRKLEDVDKIRAVLHASKTATTLDEVRQFVARSSQPAANAP
jgi:hypothetical protein